MKDDNIVAKESKENTLNQKQILRAIEKDYRFYETLSSEYTTDPKFMKLAVLANPRVFQLLPEEVIYNPAVQLEYIRDCINTGLEFTEMLNYVQNPFYEDTCLSKAAILSAFQKNFQVYPMLPQKLKEDPDFMRAALNQNVEDKYLTYLNMIQAICDCHHAENDVVTELTKVLRGNEKDLNQYFYFDKLILNFLNAIDPKYRSDREIMENMIAANGECIMFASEDIQQDPQMISLASRTFDLAGTSRPLKVEVNTATPVWSPPVKERSNQKEYNDLLDTL